MSVAPEFMAAAIAEAKQGLAEDGIPIGSVLVYRSQVLGRGHNRRVQLNSPTRHAEIDALENAGRQSASVYRECTLYTTLSPCPLCSGAVLLYGIPKVVIGDNRNFMGDEAHLKAKGVHVVVLDDQECIQLMRSFIEARPQLWNEDIGL